MNGQYNQIIFLSEAIATSTTCITSSCNSLHLFSPLLWKILSLSLFYWPGICMKCCATREEEYQGWSRLLSLFEWWTSRGRESWFKESPHSSSAELSILSEDKRTFTVITACACHSFADFISLRFTLWKNKARDRRQSVCNAKVIERNCKSSNAVDESTLLFFARKNSSWKIRVQQKYSSLFP